MKYEKELLEHLGEQLKEKIEAVQESLSKAPEGSLIIKHSANSLKFYLREKNLRYLNTKDIELKKQMIQKRYNTLHLETLEKQNEVVDQCIRQLGTLEEKPAEEVFIESLPESMRSFATRANNTDDDYASKWLNSKKGCLPFMKGAQRFFTENGELVRSKSEVLIADRLYLNHVPYKYEAYIIINGYTCHPDFTILNKRTRKEFIWEHLGLMDNQEYIQNAMTKLNGYADAGYIIGKNLIITFETAKSPINTKYIDTLIKECLL